VQQEVQRVQVRQLEAFDAPFTRLAEVLLHALDRQLFAQERVELGTRAITPTLTVSPLSPERPCAMR
jgi:hypothetical protein